MIKLFSLKQQNKEGDNPGKGSTQKRASAAQLRITKGKLFKKYKLSFKLVLFFVEIRFDNIYCIQIDISQERIIVSHANIKIFYKLISAISTNQY